MTCCGNDARLVTLSAEKIAAGAFRAGMPRIDDHVARLIHQQDEIRFELAGVIAWNRHTLEDQWLETMLRIVAEHGFQPVLSVLVGRARGYRELTPIVDSGGRSPLSAELAGHG